MAVTNDNEIEGQTVFCSRYKILRAVNYFTALLRLVLCNAAAATAAAARTYNTLRCYAETASLRGNVISIAANEPWKSDLCARKRS